MCGLLAFSSRPARAASPAPRETPRPRTPAPPLCVRTVPDTCTASASPRRPARPHRPCAQVCAVPVPLPYSLPDFIFSRHAHFTCLSQDRVAPLSEIGYIFVVLQNCGGEPASTFFFLHEDVNGYIYGNCTRCRSIGGVFPSPACRGSSTTPRSCATPRASASPRAMRRCDYRYNYVAKVFATQRTNTLGLVIPTITNTVFADSTRGLQDEATRRGYQVLMANARLRPRHGKGAWCATLLERQVDGLVLTVTDPRGEIAQELGPRRLCPPCSSTAHCPTARSPAWVSTTSAAATTATAHLAGPGARTHRHARRVVQDLGPQPPPL